MGSRYIFGSTFSVYTNAEIVLFNSLHLRELRIHETTHVAKIKFSWIFSKYTAVQTYEGMLGEDQNRLYIDIPPKHLCSHEIYTNYQLHDVLYAFRVYNLSYVTWIKQFDG